VELQLQQWIIDILRAHPTVMDVALRQRAKFEGWLKFELAAAVIAHGATDLVIEATYESGRADLSFRYGSETYYIEMKTSNTNWRIDGIRTKTRPITKNIRGIIADAVKLHSCPGQGILVFVLFPVPQHDLRWQQYLPRIATEAHLQVDWSKHCSQISLTLADAFVCDVAIGCIKVDHNGKDSSVYRQANSRRTGSDTMKGH